MALQEPFNEDAESAVVGGMLKSDEAIKAVLPILDHEHFYRQSHGLVFQQITELFQQGIPVDALAVVAALDSSERLVDAGGKVHVHELLTLAAVTPSQTEHHAKIVRDCFQRRILLRALRESAQHSANGCTADEALAHAERAVLEVRARTERGRQSIVSGYEAAQWFQEKIANPPSEERGIRTPFSFMRRWQPGRLYVLGGYQGDGKTAAAAQYARSACSDGAAVGFVAVEMSWQDLTERIVSTFGVDYINVQKGRIDESEHQAYKLALSELARWRIDLIDDEAETVAKIASQQALGRYDFLIIDHLHRMDYADRRELERIIIATTNIARRFHIPVLLLTQLHRRGDDFPRPTLASVRDTGMVEAEAAMLSFVWRKRDENKQPTDEAEWITAKNRFGRTGSWTLKFQGKYQRFEEPIAA